MPRTKSLSDIWNCYVNNAQTITEKTAKKAVKTASNINDPKAGHLAQSDKTGPNAVDNFKGPAFNRKIDDVKTMTEKEKKDKASVVKLNTVKEKVRGEIEKNTSQVINNNMKSRFDKLFEDVMGDENAQDLEALDVEVPGEGEGLGGDDDVAEDVTITLSSDQVECLRAIIAQLDGGDEDLDLEGDVGDDDLNLDGAAEGGMPQEDAEEEDDKDEKKVKEATEMKELPNSAGLGLTKQSNKVGDKTSKLAKSGKADSKVTATVDGDGKDVPDSAGEGLTKVGNNKPNSKIKGKNQEFFGV